MSKQYTSKNQANQYDKIFRENMEAALPGVIEHLLGLHIVQSEEIPDDIQHTKERKPDLLKKVTDSSGKIFILHIEYQVQNEKEMVYRMAEYRIMLLRKYGLPVQQFVLFVGNEKMCMASEIDEDRLKYSYQLIAISKVSYKIFLKSDKPEEKILAILANFGSDSDDLALRNILKSVEAEAGSEFAENRYFKQLHVLARLRRLDIKFDEAMDASVTKFFKEDRDPLFQYGKVEGKREGKAEGKRELAVAIAIDMKKESIPIEQIAKFTKLSIEEIEEL